MKIYDLRISTLEKHLEIYRNLEHKKRGNDENVKKDNDKFLIKRTSQETNETTP